MHYHNNLISLSMMSRVSADSPPLGYGVSSLLITPSSRHFVVAGCTSQRKNRVFKSRQRKRTAGRYACGKEHKNRRNQSCPCGSGKKFKFCHGIPSTASTAADVDLVVDQLRARQKRQATARVWTTDYFGNGRRPTLRGGPRQNLSLTQMANVS